VFEDVERDVGSIRLPRWGQVVPAEGLVSWMVVDSDGVPVEPIRRFFIDFVARDARSSSVRSYAIDLLRWWRWLRAVGVEWDKATPAEARDLVLWLKDATKHRRSPRTASVATAGQVNPITRKRCLGDRYEPRTIRHSNAVLRSFYQFWIDEMGAGPLINPVQLDRRGSRPNAHHNPLDPFRAEGRIRYNPKVPKRRPREMPEERWRDVFGALRSNRAPDPRRAATSQPAMRRGTPTDAHTHGLRGRWRPSYSPCRGSRCRPTPCWHGWPTRRDHSYG
jgi:hypothetical protein